MTPEQTLRRSVMSCFLWEDNFYEDGVLIGERIKQLADKVSLATVCAMAVESRNVHHLRHVSLWLLMFSPCVIKRPKTFLPWAGMGGRNGNRRIQRF